MPTAFKLKPMMLTGDADSEAWKKKDFPFRKKCLRTISDELTLSEAVDLTAPNLEVEEQTTMTEFRTKPY